MSHHITDQEWRGVNVADQYSEKFMILLKFQIAVIPKSIVVQVYPALNWALLTLGASELMVLLAGPACSFLMIVCCACLFGITLEQVYFKRSGGKQISICIYLCAAFLISLKGLFTYVVILGPSESRIIFHLIEVFIFISTAYLTRLVLIKMLNVAR